MDPFVREKKTMEAKGKGKAKAKGAAKPKPKAGGKPSKMNPENWGAWVDDDTQKADGVEPKEQEEAGQAGGDGAVAAPERAARTKRTFLKPGVGEDPWRI